MRSIPTARSRPDFIVGDDFAQMWCSALAFCQKRFERKIPHYKKEPSGGIGSFTPDSFPVFDVFRENCYVIADSNHGYKMIGVGKLVADEILGTRAPCWSRSASRALPRASSTRSRTARFPGADDETHSARAYARTNAELARR